LAYARIGVDAADDLGFSRPNTEISRKLLLESADHPIVVRIVLPTQPSVIPPSRFNAVAAEITRLIASAATRHTQLRAQR
jgi:hypothetical protein